MTLFLAHVVTAAERGQWWPDSTFGRCCVVFGLLAQAVFTARFAVQWIASERRKESHVPIAFWYLSLVGAAMLLTYAIVWKRDMVLVIGQSFGGFVYIRNLMLLNRKKRAEAESAPPPDA